MSSGAKSKLVPSRRSAVFRSAKADGSGDDGVDDAPPKAWERGEKWLKHTKAGTYTCSKCSNPLFESTSKFRYTTDYWPSFRETIPGSVERRPDHGAIEVVCMKCKLHLGHEFDDGIRLGQCTDALCRGHDCTC
jgi:hypothetical protein